MLQLKWADLYDQEPIYSLHGSLSAAYRPERDPRWCSDDEHLRVLGDDDPLN